MKQKKVMRRYDERIRAHSATLKSLPSNVNPAAFKQPGSRNSKKLRNR